MLGATHTTLDFPRGVITIGGLQDGEVFVLTPMRVCIFMEDTFQISTTHTDGIMEDTIKDAIHRIRKSIVNRDFLK